MSYVQGSLFTGHTKILWHLNCYGKSTSTGSSCISGLISFLIGANLGIAYAEAYARWLSGGTSANFFSLQYSWIVCLIKFSLIPGEKRYEYGADLQSNAIAWTKDKAPINSSTSY